jgi:hypothetical protein
MKSIMFRVLILSWFMILLVQSVLSQELIDTSVVWRIETIDGNEFFGTILSKDTTSVHLITKMLGVVTIPKSFINSCTQVDREAIKQGEIWMKNLQSARYFYSPNGYGLEKGSGYYQNTWVMFNQASIGFSNYFSLGLGMMPLFLMGGGATPVWITPKLSVPVIKEKLNVGGGVLLAGIIGGNENNGEENTGVFGIAYAVVTIGNHDRNVTAGMGFPFSNYGWSEPMVNLCGMMRVGKRGYLLTENYFFSVEGENFFIISVGGRAVWPKLSLDYGFFSPVNLSDVFVAIPWIGFTLPLGKSRSIKK